MIPENPAPSTSATASSMISSSNAAQQQHIQFQPQLSQQSRVASTSSAQNLEFITARNGGLTTLSVNSGQIKVQQQQQHQQQAQIVQNLYTNLKQSTNTTQGTPSNSNETSMVNQQNTSTIINISSGTPVSANNGGMVNVSNQMASNGMISMTDMNRAASNTSGNISIVVNCTTPTVVNVTVAVNNTVSSNTLNTSASQQQQQQQPGKNQTPSTMDMLKCLRKFLRTLLDLASGSLPDKYPLVRNLIQDLLVRIPFFKTSTYLYTNIT
jgi:hypothetical protein